MVRRRAEAMAWTPGLILDYARLLRRGRARARTNLPVHGRALERLSIRRSRTGPHARDAEPLKTPRRCGEGANLALFRALELAPIL